MKARMMGVFGMLVVLVSCARVDRSEAQKLVARYDQAVIQAYRLNDVRRVDPVVLPDSVEGRRLTGLIGVRMDMGISLDASLLSLQIMDVQQKGGQLLVRAHERWSYRDRKMGTGAPVGQPSDDDYELEYRFQRQGRAWLVSETRFTAPPRVGRQATPWSADVQTFHGVASQAPEAKRSKP